MSDGAAHSTTKVHLFGSRTGFRREGNSPLGSLALRIAVAAHGVALLGIIGQHDVQAAPVRGLLIWTTPAHSPMTLAGGTPGNVGTGVAENSPAEESSREAEVYRVGGPASEPVLLHRVDPEYPRPAASARAQGVVILEAVIRRDGTVGDVKPRRELSMGLTEAASAAVKQWRYKPAMMDGIPVEFALTVTVVFKLNR